MKDCYHKVNTTFTGRLKAQLDFIKGSLLGYLLCSRGFLMDNLQAAILL